MSEYKETEMAEFRMDEFVNTSVTLERVVNGQEMKFNVYSGRDGNGDRADEDKFQRELEAKREFLRRVREALALPEGTY